MKSILVIFVLVMSLNLGFGQYDEFKILYADGNYEKLVRSAEKLTLSDKTKKEPMPYLWMSKGLYKIHLSGTADEVYKNAYKESIAALGKFIKLDKTGSYRQDENNKEFMDLLQWSLVEQVENEFLVKNFSKAYSWVNSYKKISVNLIGQVLMEGACKFRTDDRSTALSLWKTVELQLKSITSIDDWSESDKELLRFGAIQTAECYVGIKKPQNAKELLNKVSQWFEDDADLKEAYEKL